MFAISKERFRAQAKYYLSAQLKHEILYVQRHILQNDIIVHFPSNMQAQ